MKSSRLVTLYATGLLLLSLGGSALLLRKLDQTRSHATLQEVLYVPSPKVLKRLSLGYDALLADIYWTRAVQYFGGRHAQGEQEFKLLGPLLEIATTLDPHLTVAYEYGAQFLSVKPPNGAGDPAKAAELLKFGIERNPESWRLYYNLGFVYYMEFKDYGSAADAFARGSQVPNAHPFLRILAGRMAEHAGDLQMARLMWSTSYQSTTEKSIRANAAAHLRALQVDEEVPALESLVERYKVLTGHLPAKLSDLVAAHMLREVPLDPVGNPYQLSSDGQIEVLVPDDLPFIQEGLPLGYKAPFKAKLLPVD